jgi:hypothetical protein
MPGETETNTVGQPEQSVEKEIILIEIERGPTEASIKKITKNTTVIYGEDSSQQQPIVFAGNDVPAENIKKLKAIIDAQLEKLGGSSKNRTQKRRRNQRQRKGGKSRRNVHKK